MPKILFLETTFGDEKHIVELDDVQGTCGLYFLTIDHCYYGAINSLAADLTLQFHNRTMLLYADEIQILLDAAEDYRKNKVMVDYQ